MLSGKLGGYIVRDSELLRAWCSELCTKRSCPSCFLLEHQSGFCPKRLSVAWSDNVFTLIRVSIVFVDLMPVFLCAWLSVNTSDPPLKSVTVLDRLGLAGLLFSICCAQFVISRYVMG
jgi:hypothetical protein